jgi:hypothetical protein
MQATSPVGSTACKHGKYVGTLESHARKAGRRPRRNQDRDESQPRSHARKMDANLEMLAKMEARIEANNEKFEVLRSTLVSRMDAHHANH